MGITYIEGVVTGPTGKQARVRFLMDSGATYTLLPGDPGVGAESFHARIAADAHAAARFARDGR